MLVCAGRNRLKLDEAAFVVQRRALILVCPWESRASLDDNFVCISFFPWSLGRRRTGGWEDGGKIVMELDLDEETKHPAFVWLEKMKMTVIIAANKWEVKKRK